MKKHLILVAIAALTTMMLSSCGESKEEQTKMISPDRVSLVGSHSDLLEVADSVKLLLVKANPNGTKYWTIKAIVPIKNTTYWKNVPGTNSNAKEYFIAKMGNAHSRFIDANDSEVLDGNMQWDKLESVLSANEYKTVKLELSASRGFLSAYEADYATAKEAFDKIDGMELSKLDLSKVWKAENISSSRSSSSSYDDDDLDKAIDQYERAVNAAEKALDLLN